MTPQTNLSATTSLDWLRAVTVITLAIVQPFAQFTVQTFGINDIATRSSLSNTLFTPPGFTFAIWGVIFIAMIAYGGYQIFPKNLNNTRLRKIGWWAAAAMALNIAWMLQVILTGLSIASLLIILAMLAVLLIAFFALYQGIQPTRNDKIFVIFPISIFAAWITVASIASIPTWFFNAGGFNLSPLPDGVWVTVLSIIAGLVGAAIMWLNKGNIYYASVLIWAFAGLAFKCYGLNELLAMCGALLAIIIVVITSIAIDYSRKY